MRTNVTLKEIWASIIAYLIIVCLSTQVVLLTLQNRKLKEMWATTTPIGVTSGGLQPGDRVQSFKFQTSDGSSTLLEYDDPSRKYLILVFSTTCPHCERNLPNWRSIAERATGDLFTILGVSIQSPEEIKPYLMQKKPNF